jgi:2-haloacid dehalogenase
MQETETTLSIKPQIIILDVYETLLDMSDVERRVNGLLDSRRGYKLWFELFMQYCFVDNCTIQFNDFISIAKATMQMTACKLDKNIVEFDIDNVLEMLKLVPVHEGVQAGLSALNDEGYRIAALTNSSEQVVCERMERTGLISYFECVMSAEQVKKYKPSMEVYRWAAKKMDAKEKDILFVSAHGWDIAGASNAGMETAFINHGNEMLYPLAPKPGLVCNSITDLANKLKDIQQVNVNAGSNY